jgi:hypothetical protein
VRVQFNVLLMTTTEGFLHYIELGKIHVAASKQDQNAGWWEVDLA